MIKVGTFVVSKGKENPWVYKVRQIDPVLGVALCEFVAHDGKVRDKAGMPKKDKWKALAELTKANASQVHKAVAPDATFSNMLVTLNYIEEMMTKGFSETKQFCQHNPVPYVGLRESYHYCTKCDAKFDS